MKKIVGRWPEAAVSMTTSKDNPAAFLCKTICERIDNSLVFFRTNGAVFDFPVPEIQEGFSTTSSDDASSGEEQPKAFDNLNEFISSGRADVDFFKEILLMESEAMGIKSALLLGI